MKYGLVITLILALVLFWLLTLDNTETKVLNANHKSADVRPDTVDKISAKTVKSSEAEKDKTRVKQSEERRASIITHPEVSAFQFHRFQLVKQLTNKKQVRLSWCRQWL